MTNITRRLLTLLAIVTPTSAHARPAPLSFVAPAGCPSRETFIASVESRGGDIEGLDAAVPPRSFSVVIRREGSAYFGTLTADLDDSERADGRTLQGASCEEVVEALSVTLALELRPKAAAAAPAPSEPPDSATPAVPAAEPRVTTFRGASHWGHGVQPVGDGKLHFDPKFAVTLSAGVSFGLLPIALARYDATFRMANFVTLPNGEQSIIGPILRARVGFMGSPQSEYEANGSTVSASGQSAGLGLCWSPQYDAAGFVLLGCGELGLAGYATRVKEQGGGERDSAVTLLGTLGAVLEAEYNLGPLHLSAKTGANLVSGTLEAQRADGQRLFQSKRWEASFSLGLGGHW